MSEVREEKAYDAGDARSVREKERSQRHRVAVERTFLRSVMASAEGRDWIFKTLSLCHVYQTSFSTNALTMAYHEGERGVGLRIMADVVQAAPDRYLEMLAENGDKNV